MAVALLGLGRGQAHICAGIDLQRTNSLISPYRAIVNISGAFEINSSEQNGACHPSPSAAKLVNGWWGIDRSFDMRLMYPLEDDIFKIAGGNQLFMNQFLRQGAICTINPNLTSFSNCQQNKPSALFYNRS